MAFLPPIQKGSPEGNEGSLRGSGNGFSTLYLPNPTGQLLAFHYPGVEDSGDFSVAFPPPAGNAYTHGDGYPYQSPDYQSGDGVGDNSWAATPGDGVYPYQDAYGSPYLPPLSSAPQNAPPGPRPPRGVRSGARGSTGSKGGSQSARKAHADQTLYYDDYGMPVYGNEAVDPYSPRYAGDYGPRDAWGSPRRRLKEPPENRLYPYTARPPPAVAADKLRGSSDNGVGKKPFVVPMGRGIMPREEGWWGPTSDEENLPPKKVVKRPKRRKEKPVEQQQQPPQPQPVYEYYPVPPPTQKAKHRNKSNKNDNTNNNSNNDNNNSNSNRYLDNDYNDDYPAYEPYQTYIPYNPINQADFEGSRGSHARSPVLDGDTGRPVDEEADDTDFMNALAVDALLDQEYARRHAIEQQARNENGGLKASFNHGRQDLLRAGQREARLMQAEMAEDDYRRVVERNEGAERARITRAEDDEYRIAEEAGVGSSGVDAQSLRDALWDVKEQEATARNVMQNKAWRDSVAAFVEFNKQKMALVNQAQRQRLMREVESTEETHRQKTEVLENAERERLERRFDDEGAEMNPHEASLDAAPSPLGSLLPTMWQMKIVEDEAAQRAANEQAWWDTFVAYTRECNKDQMGIALHEQQRASSAKERLKDEQRTARSREAMREACLGLQQLEASLRELFMKQEWAERNTIGEVCKSILHHAKERGLSPTGSSPMEELRRVDRESARFAVLTASLHGRAAIETTESLERTEMHEAYLRSVWHSAEKYVRGRIRYVEEEEFAKYHALKIERAWIRYKFLQLPVADRVMAQIQYENLLKRSLVAENLPHDTHPNAPTGMGQPVKPRPPPGKTGKGAHQRPSSGKKGVRLVGEERPSTTQSAASSYPQNTFNGGNAGMFAGQNFQNGNPFMHPHQHQNFGHPNNFNGVGYPKGDVLTVLTQHKHEDPNMMSFNAYPAYPTLWGGMGPAYFQLLGGMPAFNPGASLGGFGNLYGVSFAPNNGGYVNAPFSVGGPFHQAVVGGASGYPRVPYFPMMMMGSAMPMMTAPTLPLQPALWGVHDDSDFDSEYESDDSLDFSLPPWMFGTRPSALPPVSAVVANGVQPLPPFIPTRPATVPQQQQQKVATPVQHVPTPPTPPTAATVTPVQPQRQPTPPQRTTADAETSITPSPPPPVVAPRQPETPPRASYSQNQKYISQPPVRSPVSSVPVSHETVVLHSPSRSQPTIGAQLAMVEDEAGGPARVLVRAVFEDGPADQAGIRPGDQITRWAGVPLDSKSTFAAALRTTRVGARVRLHINRHGMEADVDIVVGRTTRRDP